MTHEFKETADFEDNMKFGKYIKKVRRLLGFNQTDMAEIININQGTLSMWEQGITSPPIEDAREIIELLGGELLIVNRETEEERNERIHSLMKSYYGGAW